jgi:hypothetical protein
MFSGSHGMLLVMLLRRNEMSSFLRRIERQQHPSRAIHLDKDNKRYANPARGIFYMGRGSKLGVHNPKAKDLIARLARERRHN